METANLLYSLSGLAVGCIVGLTGVGGGSLMTPLLVLLFNVHPATAVGTDLWYAGITKSVGTAVHGRHGSVDWSVVRRLGLGSVPATLATFALMQGLGLQSTKGGFIALMLGVVLLASAATLLFRARIVASLGPRLDGTDARTIAALTVATGALLGFLVTMTSVGAGAIGVTALLILYPRLQTLKIVASDIAHAVPLTLVSGFGHWMMGGVDWSMLSMLLIGSVPGIALGSLLAPRLPEKVLRIMLAVILVLVAIKLFGAF